jgi:hypothetical protein
MHGPQLGRARGELQEAERRAEGGEAAVGGRGHPIEESRLMAWFGQASGAASGESTGSGGGALRRSSMVLAVRSMASMTRRRSLSQVVGRLSTLANATMALAAWRSSSTS